MFYGRKNRDITPKKELFYMKNDAKNQKINKNQPQQSRVDRTKFPPTDYLPEEERIITDPLGSWTGTPVDDFYDKPIQDADDL